ncbi:ABC transporter permease [Rhodoferax antarcticus]|uniref:Binding--dependent transport system inner membrane component family protein n=1 Tax=Rhodoferax antarcticus ANT.BR TaxID=1111071 RepID=A0A1Q8YCT0_9BURK|nr:ABC transporter permease subunit [Rhodoferax antarcticus]APW46564.1 ABC transporter permease [Rhodoferax antarcticus]MCW2313622.1 NitT/TauT family transport system permease protein [Rhodoferax antarcticus]OLP05630.1 binding--dependent transport system inner membrane component family protein [Rhodoferax antarcticus ANT.BR]
MTLTLRQRTGNWLAATGHYLWSGWGSLASLGIFFALWELTAQNLGSLILPTPIEAVTALRGLFASGAAWPEIAITARRALTGFGLSVGIGSLLGLAAGVSMTASMMARPIITILVGMPPIAWLILALLWFGAGDGTPVFTVFIACFPIIFVGAMQGTRTLDGQLKEVARVFGLSTWMKLTDVYLPHVVSYLFPAWISALGMSWKIVVMAELLATEDGIGAALAVSRSHLDTAASMAWIVALVGTLLAIEYLLLEPIKRGVESWREFASSNN